MGEHHQHLVVDLGQKYQTGSFPAPRAASGAHQEESSPGRPDERLQLADELLDSVPDEVEDPAWQKEWAEEIRRRVEQIRAGEVDGTDADQVFSEELDRFEPAG